MKIQRLTKISSLERRTSEIAVKNRTIISMHLNMMNETLSIFDWYTDTHISSVELNVEC